MKNCSRCGEKLVKLNDNSFQCSGCGKILYLNPKPCVAVLLIDAGGNLVFGRRAIEPMKGKLDCVGGFVDIGETYEEAMLRELKEETGLTEIGIKGLHYFGSVCDDYPFQGANEFVTTAYFIAILKHGAQPKPADDISKIETMPLADIQSKDIAWPGMAEMLEAYAENLSS